SRSASRSLGSALRPRPPSTLFPYTSLFRSCQRPGGGDHQPAGAARRPEVADHPFADHVCGLVAQQERRNVPLDHGIGHFFANQGDRKSTRLNSSHVKISYAVFCLKKKITTV